MTIAIQPEQQGKKNPSHPRKLRGTVVSVAMEKTRTVLVERRFPHPRFKRVVKIGKKYLVHDAENTARMGDEVIIKEVRPLSRRKRWMLVEIAKRAQTQSQESVEEEKAPL